MVTAKGLITAGKVATSLASGVGAIGSLFGHSGSGTNVAASKALMNYQDKLQRNYTQWLNENQYSQLRTGLENAGYNPLLALGASPQQGAVGIGNATYGESKTDQIMSTLSGLAQIDNLKASTAQAQSGVLGKLLGSGGVEELRKLFGSSNGVGIAKNLITKAINSIKSNISNTASNTPVLKGYVSNAANEPFSYTPELDSLGKLPPSLLRYQK